ncbi:MAG: hypothetical protein ACLS9K_09095 [Lachnospira eligens]
MIHIIHRIRITLIKIKRCWITLIKWSFDDTRIPTNELAMILDNRRLEKSRKGNVSGH